MSRLEVSENRVLRRIFEVKKDELVRGWRKLHNEKLHNLYVFPDIIRMIKSRRMRWTRHAECMGVEEESYRVLVGKTERKRQQTCHNGTY
jgi:hypothetical protein